MAVKRVIGIDFGTSSSIVKVKTYKDGEPLGAKEHVEYIRFDGAAHCPTLIYKADDGVLFFGHKAENASVRGVLLQNFKMDLVSGDDDKKASSREYAQLFFNHLYEAYNESKSLFPPCDEEITYVSYPVKWPQSERGFMVEIAEKAGFANVVGIDEPSAAVHAVMVSANDRLVADDEDGINILLMDMGAGTTDLVLCKYNPYADTLNSERQIEILNVYPKADSAVLLGGREIDAALCEYVKAYLLECGLPNPKNFNEKYMDKCRVWKETNVSPVLNDNGIVRFAGFVDALLSLLDIDKEFKPLSRDSFEDMLNDYISQLPELVNKCLGDVGFKPSDVDYVVLTGGHSQWYFVEGVVKGSLSKFGGVSLPRIMEDGNRVIRLPWPQETVALGMVFQDIAVARRRRPSENVVAILQIISDRYKLARGRDIYVDIMADPIAAKRLRAEADKAAKTLEHEDSATISLVFINAKTGEEEHLSEVINRVELMLGKLDPKAASSDPNKTAKEKAKAKAKEKPHKAGKKDLCVGCGRQLSATALFCGYCGLDRAKASDQTAVEDELKFCGGCGNKISASAQSCPHCGRKRLSATQTGSSDNPPHVTHGNLIITLNASRNRGGIRAVQGKLSIYPHKIEYIPSKFPLPMPGDKQEFQMSEIALAERCNIMAMNIGVKLILKNGKTTAYGVGGGALFKNTGADPQEIVDIINAQIGG